MQTTCLHFNTVLGVSIRRCLPCPVVKQLPSREIGNHYNPPRKGPQGWRDASGAPRGRVLPVPGRDTEPGPAQSGAQTAVGSDCSVPPLAGTASRIPRAAAGCNPFPAGGFLRPAYPALRCSYLAGHLYPEFKPQQLWCMWPVGGVKAAVCSQMCRNLGCITSAFCLLLLLKTGQRSQGSQRRLRRLNLFLPLRRQFQKLCTADIPLSHLHIKPYRRSTIIQLPEPTPHHGTHTEGVEVQPWALPVPPPSAPLSLCTATQHGAATPLSSGAASLRSYCCTKAPARKQQLWCVTTSILGTAYTQLMEIQYHPAVPNSAHRSFASVGHQFWMQISHVRSSTVCFPGSVEKRN